MMPSTVWCSLLVQFIWVKTVFSSNVRGLVISRLFAGHFHAHMGVYLSQYAIDLVSRKFFHQKKQNCKHPVRRNWQQQSSIFQSAVKLLGVAWVDSITWYSREEELWTWNKRERNVRAIAFRQNVFVQPCKQELYEFNFTEGTFYPGSNPLVKSKLKLTQLHGAGDRVFGTICDEPSPPQRQIKHPRVQYESINLHEAACRNRYYIVSRFVVMPPFVSLILGFEDVREKLDFTILWRLTFYVDLPIRSCTIRTRSSVMVVMFYTRAVTTHSSLPILYSKVSILGFCPYRRYHTVKGKLVDWKD